MLKEKYNSINGLRTISLTFVILCHLEMQYNIFKYLKSYKILFPVINILTDGALGVNIFFVISGFLITSLMLIEEANTETVSLKNFYIRRTLRIFPAYYFLILVYFLLQLGGIISISNASWLTAITYTKYFNWYIDWYTSHSWSLSVEEHFYLFWPLIFVYLKKMRSPIAISLFLITPFARLFSHLHPIVWFNDYTIFTRIDAIAIGCVFALHKEVILTKISKNWPLTFWGSICAFILWTNIFQITSSYHIRLGFIFLPLGVGHGTIANIAIAFIMMYSVFGPHRLFYKFLNLKAMNYVGVLSYSIYLWQQFFIYNTNLWCNIFPINLLFIFLAAVFSYYIIEKPFLKLKAKF